MTTVDAIRPGLALALEGVSAGVSDATGVSVVAGVLATLGTALSLLAAVGVLRMPDLYTRMHAASKTGSLGAACVLAGAAFHFGEVGTALRAISVAVFLMLTLPVAAHMLGRAGYLANAPKAPGTHIDEWAQQPSRDNPPSTTRSASS